jgi:hypothetical protein
VEVNDTSVYFILQPQLCSGSGRVMAPARDLAAALEATVEWEPAGKKITIKKAAVEVQMTLGSSIATVNGTAVELPGIIKSRDGSAMVPVRFLAESLGFKVLWQQGEVHISS